METYINPIVVVIVLIILLIFYKPINEIIAKVFSDSEAVKIIIYLIVLIIGGGGGYVISDYSLKPLFHSEENTIIHEATKTKEEVFIDGSLKAIDKFDGLIQKGKKNKAYEDIIKQASKRDYWVYQLGDISTSKKIILEDYTKLDSVLKNKVSIFKNDNNEYAMVLMVDFYRNKLAIHDSLNIFSSRYNVNLEPLNLINTKCETIVKNEELSKKINGKRVTVNCYICK